MHSMIDPGAQPTRRSRTRTLIFALIALVLALSAAEGVLRLLDLGTVPEDRMYTDTYDVRYRLRPGAPNPCPGQEDRINYQGTRGPEFKQDKPTGVQRILCLGDSTTFGWGLSADQTYPAQLQRMIDQIKPGAFEVINGGIPGTNNYQQILFFEELAHRWTPDVVIWRVGPNGRDDIIRYRRLRRSILGRGVLTLRDGLSHSRLYRVLRWAIKPAQRGPTLPPNPEHLEEIRDDYRADLAAIKDLSERYGFVSIWVHPPQQDQVEFGRSWLAEHPDAGRAEFEAYFAPRDSETIEFVQSNGFHYVAPLYDFVLNDDDEGLFVDPGHPGETGQRICAQLVLETLRLPVVLDF
ncbi:MAG: hypothetical protein P9M14_07765 [Candidatus Alcyoniella australis]|nr:hypothetical protein [Candidatus Alcyoniella australis]